MKIAFFITMFTLFYYFHSFTAIYMEVKQLGDEPVLDFLVFQKAFMFDK